MVGFVPNKKVDIKSDDIQDIETDPRKLAFKYIRPIDSIRSIVRPKNVTLKNFDECVFKVDRDNSRPLESRAHAFLRFVGFPVAVKSGEFYNPGFNPTGGPSKTKRADVNKKFLNAGGVKDVIDRREEYPILTRSLFGRQDLSASVYALLLSTNIKGFNNLTDGVDSLDVDIQNLDIKERQTAVDSFFTINKNLSKDDIKFLRNVTGPNFTKGIHLLKPFIVDPAIDCMAMPAKNRMAVPFLKNADALKVTENISVLRPGIELIIRERLRASEVVDTVFLETVKQILNQDISPSTFLLSAGGTVDGQDLISTVAALLGDYKIDINEVNELKLTNVQTEIISQLVRTLKKMMDVLYDSIQKVLKSCVEINWVPIPSPEGPELGAKSAILRTLNVSARESKIDSTIVKLKRKQIDARHQITEQTTNLGGFASPFNATVNDEDIELVDNSLKDIEQKRDNIANDAFVAMGNIELIMGEASGLGLVDIIAVYIALWSMDEKSLISMLDNESFNRLTTNFKKLVKGAAADRQTNGEPEENIVTALNNFESKLKNVLNFAQIEFKRKGVTDGEEVGGDIYPDS